MHPPQLDEDDETETDDNDEEVSAVQIHFYECAALRNLSKVDARAVNVCRGTTESDFFPLFFADRSQPFIIKVQTP
jgi:hypothetical protein